jgi:KEOPS complex subunit Cgi121
LAATIQDRKVLSFLIRFSIMNEVRLLFGAPAIRDKVQLIEAIRNLQKRRNCVIQALDADKVVSETHLIFATEKAIAAFSQGRNIAKDPGLEILRYASGERQINGALAMGVADSTERIALILTPFGKSCSMPDASELSGIVKQDGKGCTFQPEAVKRTFCISPEEIDAVGEARIPDLVLERVALVDTYR